MCRLLCVKSEKKFAVSYHLSKFSEMANSSKEYQGHGWGCAYLHDGNWIVYHSIKPIWEDDFNDFPETTLLLAHARSAFNNKDIIVENNMPFYDGKYIFIFNGELRGVRINESGRIGAEKIFNYIKRFNEGNMHTALEKGMDRLDKRTKYIRAANIIVSDAKQVNWVSMFNEDPDYFTMHCKNNNGLRIISSAPYVNESNWTTITKGSIGEL